MRDRADFEVFVVAQTPQLLTLARALTGNTYDAWDLVQEALARVAERWDRSIYDAPAAYVRTVMVRLNIDRIRRLRREFLTPTTPESAVRELGETDLGSWLLTTLVVLAVSSSGV